MTVEDDLILLLQTSQDRSIYEDVVTPGEAVSGGVTAVYVGSNPQLSDVNRIEIVTDDFMYRRGDNMRISIPRSAIHAQYRWEGVLNTTVPRSASVQPLSVWISCSSKDK